MLLLHGLHRLAKTAIEDAVDRRNACPWWQTSGSHSGGQFLDGLR
jgi:hypothetical protein